MSLSKLLGLDDIGSKSVEEARAAISEALLKAAPLIQEIENRFGGICHGLLDRVKLKIEIEIVPIEKAQLNEPAKT